MKHDKVWLLNLIQVGFGITMFAVLVCCLLFRGKNQFIVNQWILVIIGAGILFLLYLLTQRLFPDLHVKITKRKIFIILSMLCVCQIWLIHQYYFYTGWDASVVRSCASAIVHQNDLGPYNEYYASYPNNLFLLWIFTKIFDIAHRVGLHEYEYNILLAVNCIISTMTGYLLVKIIKKITGNVRLCILALSVYVLIVGISPWISIPYSDSIGLLLPILMLYLYISVKNIYVKWIGLSFIAMVGYAIKPQIFIVYIGIIIVNLFKGIKNIKKTILCFAAACLGISIATVMIHFIDVSLPLERNPEKALGITHFFMMGLNTETRGMYNKEDCLFSMSFENKEDRREANINKSIERIREMGVEGLIQQGMNKMMINYDDGTFYWGREGQFYSEFPDNKENAVSNLMKNIFYNKEYEGKYYHIWINFEQMLWLTILVFSFIGAFFKTNEAQRIIMISIIGLTLFELLFEARSRYLFIYIPFYIILFLHGIDSVFRRIKDWRSSCFAKSY